MKNLKDFINEALKFDYEIQRDPLKLDIIVHRFAVGDYDLTNKDDIREFRAEGNGFDFDHDLTIEIKDQEKHIAYADFTVYNRVGSSSQPTKINIRRKTKDDIGLSELDWSRIIGVIHSRVFCSEFGAYEIAKQIYEYLHK